MSIAPLFVSIALSTRGGDIGNSVMRTPTAWQNRIRYRRISLISSYTPKTSCTTRIAGDEPPELGIARDERDTPALNRNFDFANRQAVGVGSNRFGWGTILFAYRVIARVFVSGS